MRIRDFDFFEDGIPVLFAALALLVLSFLGAGLLELVQERRAFPHIVQCERQQQNARRAFLSDTALCVPHPSRRDTLGLQVTP